MPVRGSGDLSTASAHLSTAACGQRVEQGNFDGSAEFRPEFLDEEVVDEMDEVAEPDSETSGWYEAPGSDEISGLDPTSTRTEAQNSNDPAAAPDLVLGALESARGIVTGTATRSGRAPSNGNSVVRRRYRRRRDAIYSGSGSDVRDPATVADVLGQAMLDLGWTAPLARARVLGQWSDIVGATIAARCQPTRLVGSELHVVAQTTAWATQLQLMAPQILARICAELPQGTVTRVRFTGPTGPSWRRGPWAMSGGRGVRDTYG